MTLYSLHGARPAPLPSRIRLPSGFTRTDPSTFTEEEILAAGYTGPYDEPDHDPDTEYLYWVGDKFVVRELPPPPPEPEPIDLKATANGILAAASTGDSESLATLLGDLVNADRTL